MISFIFILFLVSSLFFVLSYHNLVLGFILFVASIFIWVDLYFEENLKLLIPVKKYEKRH